MDEGEVWLGVVVWVCCRWKYISTVGGDIYICVAQIYMCCTCGTKWMGINRGMFISRMVLVECRDVLYDWKWNDVLRWFIYGWIVLLSYGGSDWELLSRGVVFWFE